jgi:diaminohydroxyphosphoribosylaminopyrimidine deaminase/5-amino-6-(5-phosphoribosylamino)uracil reductase
VIAAGIARVVMATRDPNPEAAGGVDRLRAAGIAVEIGLEDASARELNASFFHAFASDRPWVTVKLAVSIDGAIADATRRRGWLSGPVARRQVHEMRAGHDAIAVGLGTVLADDPRLTVREASPPRVPPARIVFDSGLRIPLTSNIVATAHEALTLIVARDASGPSSVALRKAGVGIVVASTIPEACRALRARGIQSVMVEGGARLAGSFFKASSVDRLVTFQSPVVLGEGALNAFAFAPSGAIEAANRLPVIERRQLGDDLMTVFAMGEGSPGVLRESPCSPD